MAETTRRGRRPLGPRVDDLEKAVEQLREDQDELTGRTGELEKLSRRIKTDLADTRKQMRQLEETVNARIGSVHEALKSQTEELEDHVTAANEATKQFVLATLVDVARQWSAPAIIAVTTVLAIVAAVAAGWILAATGHLHLH